MTLTKIKEAVNDLLRRHYGTNPELINKAVKALLKKLKNDITADVLKEIVADEEAAITKEFVDSKSGNVLGNAYNDIIVESQRNTKTTQDNITRNLLKVIKEASDNGITNWRLVARKTSSVVELAERHIDTNIRTAQAAFARANRVATLQKDDYIKYTGPASIRPFANDHLGKTYKVSDVMKMKNMYGQDAIVWGCGWNCRHRWVVVSNPDNVS